MPGCNIKGAQVFLEKLRKAIENINYHITGVQTVSIGATQRLKNEDFDQWYKKTDKALYQAKNLNKNCVVLGD